MTANLDELERRDPEAREADLLFRLPAIVARALEAPGYRRHLAGVDARAVTSRAALAALPVLRKSDLPALQAGEPPFAGLSPSPMSAHARLFLSPGPIFEAEGTGPDPWRTGRGLRAAAFAPGDVVLNTFSYHLTPAGFIFDSGARALGCPVIPAGPGNTEQQLAAIAAYRPVAYCGVPDFLKILLDAGAAAGTDTTFLRKAAVSGAAFPRSLQDELSGRGIAAYQLYATADIGVVAYETAAREGLVVNEDLIVEIVRPGTGDPVADGEVGEILVTVLDPHFPLIRFALGDLTAVLPGSSPCGRTNTRIRGWLGRADQTAKVKGMFVRPEQVAEIGRRHPELARLRLVVTRAGEVDAMTLEAETDQPGAGLAEAVAATLQAVTRLRGAVRLAAPGSLPNDGKAISDER
jgi:phenylacetate-CoA ligase